MQVFPAGIWLWIIKLSKPSRKIYFNSKIIDLLENYRGNHSIGENLWSALYLILCLLQTNAAEMLNGIASIWMLFHIGSLQVCVCLCVSIDLHICVSAVTSRVGRVKHSTWVQTSLTLLLKISLYFFSLNHTGHWILTN